MLECSIPGFLFAIHINFWLEVVTMISRSKLNQITDFVSVIVECWLTERQNTAEIIDHKKLFGIQFPGKTGVIRKDFSK